MIGVRYTAGQCARAAYLHIKDGKTYAQIMEEMGLANRSAVYRLIQQHQGKKRRRGKLEPDRRQTEPTTDSLCVAAIVSDGLASPYAAAKMMGYKRETCYHAVRKSIQRECLELKGYSPGAIVETAWDYNDNEYVRNVANRLNLFPSHLITIKSANIADELMEEGRDDNYSL